MTSIATSIAHPAIQRTPDWLELEMLIELNPLGGRVLRSMALLKLESPSCPTAPPITSA
jgi:hypothetical protein